MKKNLSTRLWGLLDGRQLKASGQLIAAGLDKDGHVRLCHLSTDAEPRWATESAIYVGGAASELRDQGAEGTAVPSSLRAAGRLVLDMARKFVRDSYREDGRRSLDDYLSRAEVPSFAAPFWVATITTAGVDIQRQS